MLRLSTGLIVLDERADAPARLIGCVVVADAPVIGTPTGITGPVGVAVLPVNGPLPFANTVPSEKLTRCLIQPHTRTLSLPTDTTRKPPQAQLARRAKATHEPDRTNTHQPSHLLH